MAQSQDVVAGFARGILMSVLHTIKKRHMDVVAHLKRVLDHLGLDIQQDPFPLLFPEAPT